MKHSEALRFALCGAFAGAINGLFGAGGGMLLVPMLTYLTNVGKKQVFPTSVAIILPICAVSLTTSAVMSSLPLTQSWPFLLGSIPGSLLAGYLEQKIPVKWLHRGLGILILWGGIRYLC